MRAQDQQRAATARHEKGQERDARVSHSGGPGEGDSSATKGERRPESRAAKPNRGNPEADEVVDEVVKEDQVDG